MSFFVENWHTFLAANYGGFTSYKRIKHFRGSVLYTQSLYLYRRDNGINKGLDDGNFCPDFQSNFSFRKENV